MNDKITLTALLISTISLIYILAYPAPAVKAPYIPHATIACAGTTTTTHLPAPTTITSNAIIGPGYTYYYSNIIIINGRTCTIEGKTTMVKLYPAPQTKKR